MNDEESENWTEYATMFKLPLPDYPKRNTVECINCQTPFSLQDLFDGELEENHCPACDTSAEEFWEGKKHRKVP